MRERIFESTWGVARLRVLVYSPGMPPHRKLTSDSFKTCTQEKLFALDTEYVLFWFIKTKAA